MIGVYFTLLAVLLTGLGSRDTALVAALSRRQGHRPGVLITAGAVSVLTALVAAWMATFVAPLLGPEARGFFAGLALLLGGAESLILAPRRAPAEPTRSLAALAIVVASYQLTDAARFLVFAIAVATNAPVMAATGGAIGGLALVGAAWGFPEIFAHRRLRLARRLVGAALMLAGLYVALSAIGKL